MSKVQARSAKVLDEADRFEDILNWELFTFEQNNRLWGYNPDVSWSPGEPLYTHPHLDFAGPIAGYVSQYVRPMIQECDDNEYPDPVNCEPCGVGWNIFEEKTCWNCGTEYEEPKSESEPQNRVYRPSRFYEEDIVDFNGIAIRRDPSYYERLDVAVSSWEEQFVSYMNASYDAQIMREMLGFMARPPSDLTQLPLTVTPYNPWPIMKYTFSIKPTVFDKPEVDPKATWSPTGSLFDPTKPIDGPIFGLDVPENWRELRRPIPLPEFEKQDFSSFDFASVYPESRPISRKKRSRR